MISIEPLSSDLEAEDAKSLKHSVMNMKFLVFFVATIFVTWQCHALEYQTFPLRMKTDSNVKYSLEVQCTSWRLAVEARNLIDFETVPKACEEFVADYLLGDQYRSDSKIVNQQAYFYVKTLNITDKDVFVFDVDETTLSNLQYFANHGFGTEPHNKTAFKNWVNLGEAFALPETLVLYNKLVSRGIKIVFITERPLDLGAVTATNLKLAGYHTWEKLVTRDPTQYNGKDTFTYKRAERKKLVASGYKIIGVIGDQWSDILGTGKNTRTFKLPNPIYFSG